MNNHVFLTKKIYSFLHRQRINIVFLLNNPSCTFEGNSEILYQIFWGVKGMLQNFVLKKTCQSTKSLVFIGDFSKTSTDHVYKGSLPHLSQLFAPGPRPCIGKGWSGCLAGTRTPDKNQGPTELPEAIRGNVQPTGIHEYGPNFWGSPSPEQAHTGNSKRPHYECNVLPFRTSSDSNEVEPSPYDS